MLQKTKHDVKEKPVIKSEIPKLPIQAPKTVIKQLKILPKAKLPGRIVHLVIYLLNLHYNI